MVLAYEEKAITTTIMANCACLKKIGCPVGQSEDYYST